MSRKNHRSKVHRDKKKEAKQPPPRRFSRRMKIFTVLLASLVGLALAEVAVRVGGLAPDVKPIVLSGESSVYKVSPNPVLGFELKANYRDPNANLVFSYPSTNAHGQRDIERTLEKKRGVRRIILVGDSVVEGEGLREIDDTISRQLERLYPDGTVEVLNFGVSGYCTRAEVELLEVKGLQFEPDVVILVFVENDFDNFNTQLFQLDAAAERPAIVKYLFLTSHLFRYLCLSLDLFHFRAEVDPAGRNLEALGDNNVPEGLKRLAELADRHGFQPVIAIWPRFHSTEIADGPRMPGADDVLVIERLARVHRIPTVRLSEYFEKDLAALGPDVNPRLRYTVHGDTMHPSVEGGRVAARALKSVLAALETRKQPPAPEGAADTAALEAARKHGKNEADDAGLYVNMANVLDMRGRADEAIELYRKALAINPDHALAHYNLATVFVKKGTVGDAIHHFREALKRNPEYALAHYNLGLLLSSQGKRDQADKHIRRALRLQPDLVEVHYQRGVKALISGEYSLAIATLYQVVTVKPDHLEANYNLGVAYMRAGRYTKALDTFRIGLRMKLDQPATLQAAAWILATHPNPGERDPNVALELAKKARVLTKGTDAGVLDSLAAAYAAAGLFDEAVMTAEEAIAQAAERPALAEKIQARLALYRQGRPYVTRASRSERR